MATTSVTIHLDENLKNQADMLFEEMGLNMATAFTIFTKAVVRQHKIPFEISAEIPNAETLQAIDDAHHGIGLSRAFSSVQELMEDLNADD